MKSTNRSILIVDVGQEPLAALGMRAVQMGYHALRAKTTDQALEALSDDRYDFGVIILPCDLPVYDLGRSLEAFRPSQSVFRPTLIATGSRPSANERDRLRRAGVEKTLWSPVDDHTLRFQLNAALAQSKQPEDPASSRTRNALRVPTNWPVRVRVGSRLKTAKIYSLSTTGAFLATAAPSLPKRQLAFSIPFPNQDMALSGTVVMTNVPGNLSKPNLPIGMAVRFLHTEAEQQATIEQYTLSRTNELQLSAQSPARPLSTV